MKKETITIISLMLINFCLFAQNNLITLTFSGINSNNQNVTIDSVLVENVTQALDETIYHPNLSITLEYEAGIDENGFDNFRGSSVYPNPFQDYSIISINNPKSQNIQLSVFDITGRLIVDITNQLSKGVHNYKISVSNAGIYNVIISNGKQHSALKAISLTQSNTTNSALVYVGQSFVNKEGYKTSYEINTLPYHQGDMLRFTGYSQGYPTVAITDSPTTNKSYEFEFSQFFRLSEKFVETKTPCFVNIMFQVANENHNAVDNLATESFIVKEDNQPISPTESFMYINKMSSIPYQMKTVLLLDNSASVANDLQEIKNAAINFVNNIVDKQEMAILVFSDESTLLTDFTDDVDELVAAIESIQIGFPSVDLYGSIIEAVSMWNDLYSIDLVQQGVLVALTDGDDTQGSHTLDQALNAIGDKRVYMIGLGNEINPDALEQLANPGPFYNPNQANELIENFNGIQNDIVKYANSFYWMNYMSPKTEGNHSLTLEIHNNTNTGNDSFISSNFYAGNFYSVYSGVYINPTDSFPYGKDTISMPVFDTMQLKAVTYWASEPPVYEWETSNPEKIEIIYDELDNSKIEIFPHMDSLDISTITITDLSNGYTNSVYVLSGFESFTDPRDGQEYITVVIGGQEWFAQNLNYDTTNSWCYINNSSYCDDFGRLYNWDAATTACPEGWHLPTDDEWKELEIFLGMSDSLANQQYWRGTDEGKKLKSTTGWYINNGTDEVGFNALPGGYRSNNGGYSWLSTYGYWWSATESTVSGEAWFRLLECAEIRVYRAKGYIGGGCSVRCIRD